MPSQIRNIARFGVASVAGKLYVIGGGSDRVDPLTGDHDRIFASNEVWSYDPLNRVWAQRAPMLVARAMFACCALDGKIIVAGGFTNCRKSILKAEIYDPEADAWAPLPDLRQAHSSACSGLVSKGKVHVLHKGLPTVEILEGGGSYWAVEDFSWLQGPLAMVGGELYVLSNSCIMKQRGENFPDKMVSCASEFQSRIGFGMIGELVRYENNSKAVNILLSALGRSEHNMVAHLDTAHAIWVKLCTYHEGTNQKGKNSKKFIKAIARARVAALSDVDLTSSKGFTSSKEEVEKPRVKRKDDFTGLCFMTKNDHDTDSGSDSDTSEVPPTIDEFSSELDYLRDVLLLQDDKFRSAIDERRELKSKLESAEFKIASLRSKLAMDDMVV
ncbi:hypothetical protein PR202_gb07784 [Eleusine coracana subsp. coracana]|uniref:Uncharacterized protein n=1 Tax=Eleusine coracana subsp. coracana TaxID=191504 RepID=A0AAV5EBC2_ELECO|nr:hypothetical protein PR202_gb07784 [Eleusine coracana subsp. coracana]